MKKRSAVRYAMFLNIFFSLLVLFALSGCAVKLISDYDEKTDNAVTQLHKEVETFFLAVEGQAGTPECAYENHKQFYQDSKVALSAIEVRARAIPKNSITIEQIGLLKDSLYKLEELHKLGCFSAGQVENLRNSFNSSFTAILKLELAKKRGD
jgi:hypothetical protein